MSRSVGQAWKLCSGPSPSAKYLMRGIPFMYSSGGREVSWTSSMLPRQGRECSFLPLTVSQWCQLLNSSFKVRKLRLREPLAHAHRTSEWWGWDSKPDPVLTQWVTPRLIFICLQSF